MSPTQAYLLGVLSAFAWVALAIVFCVGWGSWKNWAEPTKPATRAGTSNEGN